MASHNRILLSAFALASAAALSGLSACNNSTGEADPRNIQDSIRTFLTPALMDTLKKYGMPIHEGNNPPNIEGFFYANSQGLDSSNVATDAPNKTFRPMSIKLFGQTADQRVSLEYDQTVEKGSGLGAFITGSGEKFTLYVPIKAKATRAGSPDTVDYETAVCYSGRIDTAGIHDFVNGLVITKKEPDPLKWVLEVGQGRVIGESDSLAAKAPTYPFFGVNPLKLKVAAGSDAGGGGL
jgi:hypothetical protein